MGYQVLGVDISPAGIKAVQVKTELNGKFRITAFAEHDLQTAGGLSGALNKILEDERMQSDLCVTSLPAAAFSFRNIRMPFREKRKIRQTLNYELEPLIPHPIEDVLTDFIMLDHLEKADKRESVDTEAVSDLFVAAVPKWAVQERLQALEPMRVPIVEIETVPTALALISAGYCQNEPFMLLDVGSDETVVVFVKGGNIFHVRSFAFGGNAITAALASTLHLDTDKAERQKRAGSFSGAEPEIARVCDKFFAELNHTMQFLNLRGPEGAPSRLVVTGGGASDLFIEELTRCFSMSVEKLDLRTLRHASIPADAVDAWDPMRMNNALALAMRGTRKGNGFNFRKSEFTEGGHAKAWKENFRRIAVVLLVVFGILILDSGAGYMIDQRRLANLKTEITGILKKNCPEITRVVDPVQQFKSKVTEAKRFDAAGGMGWGAGIIDLLKKISEAVPPSTNWLITDLDYDGDKVQIRAEADNFDSVEAIKRNIADSGPFRNVTVGGANLVKEKNKIEFELRMSCAR